MQSVHIVGVTVIDGSNIKRWWHVRLTCLSSANISGIGIVIIVRIVVVIITLIQYQFLF